MSTFLIRIVTVALLTGFVSLVPSIAKAGCNRARCVERIDYMMQTTDGLYVNTEGDETPLACEAKHRGVGWLPILLTKDHPAYEELHSILMSALITKKTVHVAAKAGVGGRCELTEVIVYRDK